MKKGFAWFLALILVFSCAGAFAAEDSVAALLERGKLILGLDDSFPPMGFRNEANEIVGYDIDVARELCARLGVELELQPISWSAKELELDSRNIDCIWNGMSITPDRQASMSMTFAYMNNAIELYCLKDSGIASLDDMADKAIGVQTGSFAEEVLDSAEYETLKNSVAEVLSYDDYLTALMDLLAGNIDGVLLDQVVGVYYINSMGADQVVPVVSLADDFFGIGIRKDEPDLRDKFEEILNAMAADGTLAEITTQWFGSDISTVGK